MFKTSAYSSTSCTYQEPVHNGTQCGTTQHAYHKHTSLVEYDSEPKVYPRSGKYSKDISPSSSNENELWASASEDVMPYHAAVSEAISSQSSYSRSSMSPSDPLPPTTDTSKPIFFASSRRGSRGSTEMRHESSTSTGSRPQTPSRRSSRTESESGGSMRRDSKSNSYSSGAGDARRDSRTTLDSGVTSTSQKDSKSASLDEVLNSLLAIPLSSRSSSPTSPRRSKSPGWQQNVPPSTSSADHQGSIESKRSIKGEEDKGEQSFSSHEGRSQATGKPPKEEDQDHQHDTGKNFDSEALSSIPPTPSSPQLFPLSPEEKPSEYNGSFCRSIDPCLSPLEDDFRSPTSMEVLVPDEEEEESLGEDDAKDMEFDEDLGGCPSSDVPPAPSACHKIGDMMSTCLPDEESELCVNPFAGLPPGSYCRGIADGDTLPRRHSLCLVLLHLPCMVCARPLAPPSINSFHSSTAHSRMICSSEPSTPLKETHNRGDHDGGASPCVFHQPVAFRDPCLTDPYVVGPDSGNGGDGSTNGANRLAVKESTGRGTHQAHVTAAAAETSKKKKSSHHHPHSSNTGSSSGHMKCHRPKCTKSLPADEARAKFRTCPNCYTYYCSRQCRKLHWARHKDQCPHTRISNLCKQVLLKARDDHMSRRHLSLCARRGLLSRGRGAVKLMFLSPEDALDYLVHGWENTKGQTLYVSRSDLLPQEMGSDVFSQVRTFCDKYNPERKFILLAAITVTSEASATQSSYLDREVVIRGAKMHLSPSLPEDDVQTLILTITNSDPRTGDAPESTEEERKHGLNTVEEQLSSRGVEIPKLFPDVYAKILRFVEKNIPFAPINIFPTDKRSGRVFMCIILPWADADIIVNISSKSGINKSSRRKWIL